MRSRDQLKAAQRKERQECLSAILESKAKKKIIVAGPGTGKTFTFCRILGQRAAGNNLAMTFIKKLVADMAATLGDKAEVRTFHAYCNKMLCAGKEKPTLVPFLTKIIQKDAELLHKPFKDFDTKFRTLCEGCPDIAFYITRGDYYGAVGFDDSVYRLYKQILGNSSLLPDFDQVVIDEFQDFNPLEVAFIAELSKKGDILIVGDDDQAVYDDRSASPKYLRKAYASKHFTKFELPFCSRCPEAVVDATNCIIRRATRLGHLKGRIPKRFECYLEEKDADSQKYPKIVMARCSLAKVIPNYINAEIQKIDPADIAESNREGKDYPTVLVVGNRQYLRQIENALRNTYPQLNYASRLTDSYGIINAYECLLQDPRSNLGWRILVEMRLEKKAQERILDSSKDGTPIIELVSRDFKAKQLHGITLLRAINLQKRATKANKVQIAEILGRDTDTVLSHFISQKEEKKSTNNKAIPTILLTSFKGCKGLSAGHVFIVGVHNGSIPKKPNDIRDLEICQFIVALTRTRKQCHIISNDWLIAPIDRNKNYLQPFADSEFVKWIPKTLVEDRGRLRAKDIK